MIEPGEKLRRSAHFVPGANEHMLLKALTTQADSLILDLEDAVTPEQKSTARATIAEWLKSVNFGSKERVVRMNPLDTPWGTDDLQATMKHPETKGIRFIRPPNEGISRVWVWS